MLTLCWLFAGVLLTFFSSDFWGAVACELLRTDKVQFWQSGSCGCAYPQQQPEDGSYERKGAERWRREQFAKGGAHVDTWVGK